MGSISGSQQASAPVTAPIQTKLVLKGSRLLHCSPQLGQVITLKSLGLFQRSRVEFFLLVKKKNKIDELAELPLAGTWSQVSE